MGLFDTLGQIGNALPNLNQGLIIGQNIRTVFGNQQQERDQQQAQGEIGGIFGDLSRPPVIIEEVPQPPPPVDTLPFPSGALGSQVQAVPTAAIPQPQPVGTVAPSQPVSSNISQPQSSANRQQEFTDARTRLLPQLLTLDPRQAELIVSQFDKIEAQAVNEVFDEALRVNVAAASAGRRARAQGQDPVPAIRRTLQAAQTRVRPETRALIPDPATPNIVEELALSSALADRNEKLTNAIINDQFQPVRVQQFGNQDLLTQGSRVTGSTPAGALQQQAAANQGQLAVEQERTRRAGVSTPPAEPADVRTLRAIGIDPNSEEGRDFILDRESSEPGTTNKKTKKKTIAKALQVTNPTAKEEKTVKDLIEGNIPDGMKNIKDLIRDTALRAKKIQKEEGGSVAQHAQRASQELLSTNVTPGEVRSIFGFDLLAPDIPATYVSPFETAPPDMTTPVTSTTLAIAPQPQQEILFDLATPEANARARELLNSGLDMEALVAQLRREGFTQ